MPLKDKIVIKQITAEINGGCNYSCQMCPQAAGREKDFLKKLPLDLFKKIVDDGMQFGLEVVSLHGSGEPTLNNDMPEYVRYVKERGLQCHTLTNGFKLDAALSERLIDAGLDYIRVSAIGYDRETYHRWMSRDAFDLVRENVKTYKRISDARGGKSAVELYHTICDLSKKNEEVQQYIDNWIDYTGARAEIWMMHNWAGLYDDIPYSREKKPKRTCGRPFSEFLYVRAGGTDGHKAAVVPCCYVLGQDSKAVMGHLDDTSIRDVIQGEAFEHLRRQHARNEFEELSYCKNCDQLYDAPESLVWTNIPGKQYGQPKDRRDTDFVKQGEEARREEEIRRARETVNL